MPRFGARLGFAAALAALALIAAAIAIGYLAESVSLTLQASGFAASAAAAITGAGAIVVAVILGFSGRLFLRARPAAHRRPATRSNGVATDIAADLGALAAQQIVATTREHPYGTMGAALAAGIAVGAIPELRKTLTGIFKH